jgi:F-type H+-transporting ATPase subunit delta
MASVEIRYARAFADVVTDLKLDAGRAREQLRSLAELMKESSELTQIWRSPSVPQPQKLKLLDAIAERAGMETAVRNFVAVLIDHGRINQLPQIVRQFELELDHRLGFIEADVVSARDLSAEEKAGMEVEIGRLTGRKVRANYRIDPEILGGAMARVGSTIYDGSLRGQLRRIREELSAD